MEQPKSSPVDWVGKEHLGFVINAVFSDENTSAVMNWLGGLRDVTDGGIHAMQPEGLHITVLDWIAPLFDYGGTDKRRLYEKLRPGYDAAFRPIIANMEPFDVHFTEVRVTPEAIILVGQDDGQFQFLRQGFMDAIDLPEGGKQPPSIIHSSLARFVAPEIGLTTLEGYARNNPIDFTQRIDEFRLVETRREPMQDFTILDTYRLGKG